MWVARRVVWGSPASAQEHVQSQFKHTNKLIVFASVYVVRRWVCIRTRAEMANTRCREYQRHIRGDATRISDKCDATSCTVEANS